MRIYNIHTSKVLKTLRAPNSFVSEKYHSPAFTYPALPSSSSGGMEIDSVQPSQPSKGEAWVVCGSENGKVVIWELSSRRVAQVLEEGGHQAPVVALAVSPDGRTIASGSLEPERLVHIWRDSD